ncbi:iron complex transport system substrate-binding protein [Nocardia transvalensis]|uniref:Iron complex transport system substrate-binding protein n=1 Tax=Nocardia transvalensis TaxID=37333 RepID=A0A7W9PJF2_9NOCA|nr:ABC transporter substrate-binding protein [Nocardia transvalensis]MBB5917225.1 iron complex transport system substrate-binding protein [Nocardia transvalensis]
MTTAAARTGSAGLTRRGLFAAAGAAGLAALAACGRGPDDEPLGPGAWSFTDDRGRTARAERIPSRIVAFTGSAATLADYGLADRLVGVFGEVSDGARTGLSGDLDIGKLTVVGDAWGEFDVERYASLEPDLLVTDMYVRDRLWYVPDESVSRIESINPAVAAVSVAQQSLPVTIGRYEQLAVALGADPGAAPVARARERFQAAAQAVRDAVAVKPGLRVQAASAAPGTFYVSDPRASADLRYFQELGVALVTPEKVDSGGFYESLSWENADKYPADLILLDSRSSALQPDALAGKPLWRTLPAVRAGRISAWNPVFRFSYAGTAPVLERLADALRAAATPA